MTLNTIVPMDRLPNFFIKRLPDGKKNTLWDHLREEFEEEPLLCIVSGLGKGDFNWLYFGIGHTHDHMFQLTVALYQQHVC